uniref:Uncharacterized protein n=1 Tax=Arundo donax TaxID=35708 RepID=A0A0A9B7U6_ARUDO
MGSDAIDQSTWWTEKV